MENTSISSKDGIMQTEFVYRDWYTDFGGISDDDTAFDSGLNWNHVFPTTPRTSESRITQSVFTDIYFKYANLRKIICVCGIVTNFFMLLLLASRPLLVSGEKLRYRSANLALLTSLGLSHLAFLCLSLSLDIKYPEVELYGFCLYDLAFVAFNTGQWLLALMALYTLLLANKVTVLDGSTKQFRIWLLQSFVVFCMVVLVQFSLRHVNIHHTICAVPNPTFQTRLYIFGYFIPTACVWFCIFVSWLRFFFDCCCSRPLTIVTWNLKRILDMRLPSTIFLTTVASIALPFRIEPIISLFDLNLNDKFFFVDEISTIYYTLAPLCCVILVEVREMFASCLKRGHRDHDLRSQTV